MNGKWLGYMALCGALFFACSTDDIISDEGSTSEPSANNDVAGDTLKPLWQSLSEEGVVEFFSAEAAKGRFAFKASSLGSNDKCSGKSLKMDDNTRYLDELESIYQEGELVDGVCGKALLLKDGEVAPLGVNLIDSMKAGTVEFWFRPGADFYDKSARTLLGNDGARVHFFYKKGELIFQKNHADIHYFVRGKVTLDEGWNHIAGQWGDGFMSLWVNDEMVARMEHTHGYVPAMRDKPFENLLVIGYKSYCCMEGPGQHEPMSTSGAFDQFRISNIPRYKMENLTVADTTVQDTTVVDTLPADTLSADTVRIDTIPADTTVIDTAVTDTLVADTVSRDSVASDTAASLWETFNSMGSSNYFVSFDLPAVSAFQPGRCSAPAFVMDEQTLYLDELETIYREGELVEGVCGKAVSLKDGEVAPLGINLVDSMKAGTVEFWFRPGPDFYEKSVRTLLGNDDSRLHFLYNNGEIIFQKNHANRHYYVKGEVQFKADWNHIAGQWGDGFLSVWVNDEKVAEIAHTEGYVPAARGKVLENLIVIGFKSDCCMEGPGIYKALTTSGAYDQLRVSIVPRYRESVIYSDVVDSLVVPVIVDTLVVDSL